MRYLLLLVCTTTTLWIAESKQCSYSHLARKYFLPKIADLGQGELLVEVRLSYRIRSERLFSFEVIRLWNDDNGSVTINDSVNVKLEETASNTIEKCFWDMSPKEYLLVVREVKGIYYPVLPPLPLRSYHKRKETWNKWCSTSPNDCRLKVSRAEFPPLMVLGPNEMLLIPCRASSKSEIQDLRWLKDGRVIEDGPQSAYALSGISVRNIDEGTSYLSIEYASAIHSGTYSCVAVDEHDKVELKSQFVFGSAYSAFTTCPSGKEDFCLSGSTCKGIVGIPNEAVCICEPGFDGARCHKAETPLGKEVFSDNDYQKENTKLKNTVTALTVVMVVTSCCLAIALFSLFSVTRRRREQHILASTAESSNQRKSLDSAELETLCVNKV